MEMLSKESIVRLEKQQYRVVGSHSTVKICGWTKNMIKGRGGCYKLKFYGIMSHQCLQMTPSMSCANRCKFCWRDYKAPVSKDWKWDVNEPEYIIKGSLEAQKALLMGFNGNDAVIRAAYLGSRDVKHVALSLNGEPITYPEINKLIKGFHKKGISTFLVTNGQHPKHIEELAPVTQLYISVDAPNKELLKEIDNPLFEDYWEKTKQSLKALAAKKQRTTIRLTIMKGINDVQEENYAELIKLGDADFVEIKGYMHVGASQERLERKQMPFHDYMLNFARKVNKYLADYEIVSEHIPSRVILLAKKTFKKENGDWWTWIDFKAFDKLANESDDFSTQDYMRKTPRNLVGIKSEDNTADEILDIDKKEYMSVCEQGSEDELE